MRASTKILLAAVLLAPGLPEALAQSAKDAEPLQWKIERLDPRIDQLIPGDAVLENLAGGFQWSEGPVWISAGEYLLFSDIPRNTIYRWKDAEGISVFLKPSGYTGSGAPSREPGSNGLTIDLEGRLILCEHGDRRVTRLEKDGRKHALAIWHAGRRLNSPNDAVVKSNGDIYFTDPPYGLSKLNDDPAKEIPWNGIYRISKDCDLALLSKDMTFPNGLAFSPDEKILYVANSDTSKALWMAFEVKDDGTLGAGKVFFDATPWTKEKDLPGLPDGLKVDRAGNLFATGPGGVNVFAPDGAHLGRIKTGVPTANCGWGGDGSVLYITANHNLCRIRLSTRGKGF